MSLEAKPESENDVALNSKDELHEDGFDQEIQRAIAEHERELLRHQLQAGHEEEAREGGNNAGIEGIEQQEAEIEKGALQNAVEGGTEAPPAPQVEQAQEGEQARESFNGKIASEPSTNNEAEAEDANVFSSSAEKHHLELIADELKKATSDTTETKSGKPTHIPADSELLATNTALAAYNALSSQVPLAASLTNVHLAALPLPLVTPDYLPARIQLLMNTLPVLDNLATQLLRVFVAGPYQKIIEIASSPDTPQGAAFRDLASLFEFTKRLYSEEDPFLTVEHLAPGMWKEGDTTPSMFRYREQSIESSLRKVNLATFLAACLGTIELGFFYLNESFLDVFCPSNNLEPANSMSNMTSSNMSLQSGVNTVIGDKVGKLLKPQAVLYLDLKTQAYISAIEAAERTREEILEDIFPSNMEEILLKKRGVKNLAPIESDFISRCKARKKTLLEYPVEGNLSEEYEWFTFLKDLFDYISKNMGFLIWGKKGKSAPRERTHTTPHSDQTLQGSHRLAEVKAMSPTQESFSGQQQNDSSEITHARDNQTPQSNDTEINEITSALLPSEILEQQIHLRINPRQSSKLTNRRPWTRDEEKALRHALELKGPAWSTILELFGPGGRINESLKNRTQVQLKDKARNWKMFFLKLGLPVPVYLQKVTGDLEREDKFKAKNARQKKTAAAPVPAVVKRADIEEEDAKKGSKKRRKL